MSIESYLGYPWKLFADPRSTKTADCFGIAAFYLSEEFDIDIFDFETVESKYKRIPLHHFELIRLMTTRYNKNLSDFVRVESPQKGDLAVWKSKIAVLHFGVFINANEILTSYLTPGSRIINFDDDDIEIHRHKSLVSSNILEGCNHEN